MYGIAHDYREHRNAPKGAEVMCDQSKVPISGLRSALLHDAVRIGAKRIDGLFQGLNVFVRPYQLGHAAVEGVRHLLKSATGCTPSQEHRRGPNVGSGWDGGSGWR
jgi:hypothetical protein